MNNETIIKTIAIQTLSIEKETIEGLVSSINTDFCAAVELIFKSKGRVVITGIGKSAIIAKKIVATLNSTGTPSIFMHAADAIHGDLGMIQPADIVLCISKSGETAEIKVLVPLLKHLGNQLIGMASNKNSFLAKQADYLLHTPVSKEADPNNLAPTASTTAQLVMGDALATSLLALNGFTPNDFAQFHPGGALGKQLYLTVDELYKNNERPVVQLETSIKDTIIEMTSKRLGVTVVVNEKQLIQGIITDGDLRRMLEKEKEFLKLTAKNIMSTHPKMIHKNELAVNAFAIMKENNITQLIVVDEDAYLGIVHLHDLIREGLV
ncbi:MAG TPA: KpsF/GutQ family sugar-phosphate isomerase [Saprospiraceae bacterium]|nr:KpsF/GutQ family sugar-phosphate isomerase [Saprospiraceae bacterium]